VSKTSITIDFDPDQLTGYTDARLAMLWHLVQANPADGFEHSQPGDLAARVGWEIIRRWLKGAPIEMYRHQQSHYAHHQLGRFASYKPGSPDFHSGQWEARAIPDTPEMWELLEAKLAEMGAFAGTMDRRQMAQELTRAVLPQRPSDDRERAADEAGQ
jgi:hypothetical protein